MLQNSRQQIDAEISKAVIGQKEIIDQLLIALFAGGHCLITGAPGLAKTLLVNSLAQVFKLKSQRIQFTPDLMPADITGTEILAGDSQDARGMKFVKGPVFTNILLADEINRTPPRTQSALLEAMNEGQVSVEGQTIPLQPPFFVLATQNPYEFEGTYPLPENQLDRFMMCIDIGYPERSIERDVLIQHRSGEPVDTLQPVLTVKQLREMQQAVCNVRVDDSLTDYILEIVDMTRNHPELTLGVSTRGAITYSHAAQSKAFTEGRDYVTPDDIKQLAVPVLAHRVITRSLVRENQRGRASEIIRQILQQAAVPG
ncbi:MAG: MoxR family ATPase [Planctomycetaceae bacterium]|nr:MoxR family ATPase [Planctomycetaceae bacterium]